jgi:hypothetical protein
MKRKSEVCDVEGRPFRLRGAGQILRLSAKRARELVAIQQRIIAEWEALWARGGNPDDFDEYDQTVATAEAIERKVLPSKPTDLDAPNIKPRISES